MAASNIKPNDLFYNVPAAAPYCLGHIRIDFGKDGDEYWTKFFEHTNTRQLMTEALWMECNQQVKKLYEMGMTRHLKGMRAFCDAHSEAEIGILWDGWTREYGFREESENLVFYVRCRPIRGDYQAYIYIYTKHFEEKLNEGAGPKTHERINGPGLD